MKNIIKINKDQFILIVYLLILISFTYLHNSIFFLLCIFIILIYLLLLKKVCLKKKFRNFLFFSFFLSFSYVLFYYLSTNKLEIEYFFLFNLRIISIYLLTSLIFESISIFRVFAFSEKMIVFITLLFQIIYSYQRFYFEYLDILKSKGFFLLSFNKKLKFLSYFIFLLFLKLEKDWEEISNILESRGFNFDEE